MSSLLPKDCTREMNEFECHEKGTAEPRVFDPMLAESGIITEVVDQSTNHHPLSLKELPTLDPNLVAWDGPTDPTNPKNWSMSRKWAITLCISFTGLVTISSCSIVAPALPQMSSRLSMSSTQAQMALSIYLLAIAFGPLVLSPLSELYGRSRIVHACNAWFFIWTLACGFAKNKIFLIIARFLSGLGGSMTYAVGSGVLGDCWLAEQRGQSMAVYQFVPFFGSAVGPICGAYISEALDWRFIFFILAIVQAVIVVTTLLFYRESHAPTLLHRKAEKLRKATGNTALYTAFERQDVGRSVIELLRKALSRPLRLLITHPILQVVAVIGALNYGILFLVLSTLSALWTTRYHQSVDISGLHYIAVVVGELLAVQVGAYWTDKTWKMLKKRRGGVVMPEYRVPLMLPGAVLVPAGLFWYGWSAQATAFWLVPDIGVALFGYGFVATLSALQTYVIDAFPEHAASANAGSSFVRSVFGFVFPLFAPQMYSTLGYGWGNSLLGFIAVIVGFGGPAIMWTYGPGLRARARSSY